MGEEVSRIEPETGRVVETIPAGGSWTGAIATGEGTVWVENHSAATVSRIDPFSNRVVETIPITRQSRGIAAGEGAVWVSVVR
ncbi:MAG: YncE family protein [Gaiellaceae bacterium]